MKIMNLGCNSILNKLKEEKKRTAVPVCLTEELEQSASKPFPTECGLKCCSRWLEW